MAISDATKEKFQKMGWWIAAIPYLIAAVFGAVYIFASLSNHVVFWHQDFLNVTGGVISGGGLVLYGKLLWVMGFLFLTVAMMGIVICVLYKENISFALIFVSSFTLLIPCLVETLALGAWLPLAAVLVSLVCWIGAVALYLLSAGHR